MTDKLATAPHTQLAPARDEFTSFLERAAKDPTIDVDKLERLLALKEKQDAQERKRLFFEALARLQARLEPIVRSGTNQHTSQKYVRLDDLLAIIKPLCQEEGFAFSFDSKPISGGIDFSCEMAHGMGHSEVKHLVLPVDAGGSKNAVQAVGSSTTYARRYLLDMHLNLARRGEDDDGAGGSPRLTDDQVATVKETLAKHGGNVDRFLGYMKAGTFEDILASELPKARKFIEDLKRAK